MSFLFRLEYNFQDYMLKYKTREREMEGIVESEMSSVYNCEDESQSGCTDTYTAYSLESGQTGNTEEVV